MPKHVTLFIAGTRRQPENAEGPRFIPATEPFTLAVDAAWNGGWVVCRPDGPFDAPPPFASEQEATAMLDRIVADLMWSGDDRGREFFTDRKAADRRSLKLASEAILAQPSRKMEVPHDA